MAKTPLTPFCALASATVLACCLLLAGCASTATVSSADKTTPEAAGYPVVLLDDGMNHYVAVDNVISTRNSGGYLVVQANIRSQTEKDFSVQIQTVFYDQNNIALNASPGDDTPWTTVVLSANATVPYTVQSLSPRASRFTLRLRYVKRPVY